ncbi:MAG: discoidin domain-containing protein [Kiritimatiellae bacterium]|nr:discoidin domain-containing protein [Kiritimatiellia bacterium]
MKFRKTFVLLSALIVLAAVFRIGFFIFGLRHVPISTDEAWPALMGMHVLKGEFPVFYWGQNYMGSHQAFFDALIFAVCGVNTFAARLYPLFFSFLFLAASGMLARRLYGRETALTTLAILVVPPAYLSMAGALSVPPEYLPLTALGSCALVLLAGIALKKSPTISRDETPVFLLLGLLLGCIFWLHLVSISYIAVALLFVFLRDKLFFLRPAVWISIAAFFIGSFPFWQFNCAHGFITFSDMGGTGDWQSAWQLLKALFGVTLHFITGIKIMLYGDSCHFTALPVWLAVALGLIICFLLLTVLLTRWRGMRLWLKWLPNGADGTAILLALALAVGFLFCRSERSAWHNTRFLLPVMSAMPVLLAAGLERLRQWNRHVFLFLLAIIIGAQAWGNILLYRAWRDPETVAKKLELPDTSALRRFLREHGIFHAYAHYWISYRITFESREQIVCAEPFNERFPGRKTQYLDEVHAAANIAFITHPTLNFVGDFEKHLAAIGGTYHQQKTGDFTVYYDFLPPYGRLKLREIDRAPWQFSSGQYPENLDRMADGKLYTSWTTGAPQKNGDQIMIDLGREEKICKVRFDLAGVECDAPNGYRLEISRDGTGWRQVYESGPVAAGFYWENGQPWMHVGNDFYTAVFAPLKARYLRLTLTAGQRRFWWSIAELRVFGPEEK